VAVACAIGGGASFAVDAPTCSVSQPAAITGTAAVTLDAHHVNTQAGTTPGELHRDGDRYVGNLDRDDDHRDHGLRPNPNAGIRDERHAHQHRIAWHERDFDHNQLRADRGIYGQPSAAHLLLSLRPVWFCQCAYLLGRPHQRPSQDPAGNGTLHHQHSCGGHRGASIKPSQRIFLPLVAAPRFQCVLVLLWCRFAG